MSDQVEARNGNHLVVRGGVRLPFGSQIDFSNHPEPIGSITQYMEPIKPGAYYCEVWVDDNYTRTSLGHRVTPTGLYFQFVPPLPPRQTYGFKYFRIDDNGDRYDIVIEGIL
jgi:hypothetical protein